MNAAGLLSFLAVARLDQGDYSRAKRLVERGLALSREAGHSRGSSIMLYVLARLAHAERNHEQARRLFEENLTFSAEVGDKTRIAYCLEGWQRSPRRKTDWCTQRDCGGAAVALLETIEVTAYPYAPDRSLYQEQVAAARTRLDEHTWVKALTEGGR